MKNERHYATRLNRLKSLGIEITFLLFTVPISGIAGILLMGLVFPFTLFSLIESNLFEIVISVFEVGLYLSVFSYGIFSLVWEIWSGQTPAKWYLNFTVGEIDSSDQNPQFKRGAWWKRILRVVSKFLPIVITTYLMVLLGASLDIPEQYMEGGFAYLFVLFGILFWLIVDYCPLAFSEGRPLHDWLSGTKVVDLSDTVQPSLNQ